MTVCVGGAIENLCDQCDCALTKSFHFSTFHVKRVKRLFAGMPIDLRQRERRVDEWTLERVRGDAMNE